MLSRAVNTRLRSNAGLRKERKAPADSVATARRANEVSVDTKVDSDGRCTTVSTKSTKSTTVVVSTSNNSSTSRMANKDHSGRVLMLRSHDLRQSGVTTSLLR